LLALLLLISPAAAQDTPAPDAAPIPTQEVTVITPAPTPDGRTDSFVVLSVWQIVAGLAAAFSVGGLTIGTGLGVLASRLRHNEAAMAAIEGLAASTPDSTVQTVSGLIDKFQFSLTESFALIREALDRVPYASKTPEERDAVTRPGPTVTAQSAPPAETIITINNEAPAPGGAATGSSAPFPDAAG
jgi:hypothetical protein